MTEKDLQRSIVHAARELGWRDAWTWKSFHSPKGWPDLFLARGLHLVVAELKSDKGKVTPEQETWLAWWREYGRSIVDSNVLAQSSTLELPTSPWPALDVFVWRPADLDFAYHFLATGRAT